MVLVPPNLRTFRMDSKPCTGVCTVVPAPVAPIERNRRKYGGFRISGGASTTTCGVQLGSNSASASPKASYSETRPHPSLLRGADISRSCRSVYCDP